MMEYKIKQVLEDFYVYEVPLIPHTTHTPFVHTCLLEKSGYRTIEAIGLLEKLLDIKPPEKIGFSGLKDEDGISLQYITLPYSLSTEKIHGLLLKLNNTPKQYIRVTPITTGNEHLKVGKLHGNCFRVKIRNLSSGIVDSITTHKEHFFQFINYYGPQRFGLPNQLKNTNLIGEALIKRDYALAFRELCKQNSPESEAAKKHSASSSHVYFESMDDRLTSFYQSSYFSSEWNQAITFYIHQHKLKSRPYLIDDITYSFLSKNEDTELLAPLRTFLKNKRAIVSNGTIEYHEYSRPLITQTNIIVENSGDDELNLGKKFCTISFFLPSGCYASILIPQFLTSFRVEYAKL